MKLGRHVSIAGGIDKAPARASELGCNCLQVFASNPRGWNGRSLKQGEAAGVKQQLQKYSMVPLVVHAIYLVNLASPSEDIRQKSLASLQHDYDKSGKIGADYLVFHPGSHSDSGLEKGIRRVIDGLNYIFQQVDNQTKILLENTAGSGSSIGSKFIQLRDIIEGTDEKQRLGVCLDTCHAFAAGYDLRSHEGVDRLIADIDEGPGLDRLQVVHFNDSRYPLASNRDEHAHIGEGEIGREGMAYLINHSQLKDLSFILETPPFTDEADRDIETVLALRDD